MLLSDFNARDEQAVGDCRLLADCAPEDCRRFLREAEVTVYEFAGGEVILPSVRQGRMAVVLSGSVRLYADAGEGSTVLINVVGRLEVFDLAALLGDEASPVSLARTAGRSRIAFLHAQPYEKLAADCPTVSAACFRFLCGRVKFLNQRIHTLSCGHSEQKLADYLLNEFEMTEEGAVVRLQSCSELSHRLGISRATLYRALGTLEENGLIEREGKCIRLLALERMQAM